MIEKTERIKILLTKDNGDIEYGVLNNTNYYKKSIIWCIVFLLAGIVCFSVHKWLVCHFLCVISYIFALCTIVLYGYLYHCSNLLRREEASWVVDEIRTIVGQDANLWNKKVVSIKFCSDTWDLYGAINEEYVLVLLSDDIVLKFPIKQLTSDDKLYCHKLIKKEFSVCMNKTQKQKILRPNLLSQIINSSILITLKIWIIIMGILAVGVVVILLYSTNIDDIYDAIILFFISLALLACIPFYYRLDKKLPSNKICNLIRRILFILVFVLKQIKMVMPSLAIMIMLLFMFIYSFCSIYLIVLGVELLGYEMTLSAKLFILITLPLIVASQCSKLICNMILKYILFRESEPYEHSFLGSLVQFLYTKENLNFIVYAGYFFFLAISTFKTFQTGEALLNRELDFLVLKSFLVYIACTNMFDRKKSSSIKGKRFLILLKNILNDGDDKNRKQKRGHINCMTK